MRRVLIEESGPVHQVHPKHGKQQQWDHPASEDSQLVWLKGRNPNDSRQTQQLQRKHGGREDEQLRRVDDEHDHVRTQQHQHRQHRRSEPLGASPRSWPRQPNHEKAPADQWPRIETDIAWPANDPENDRRTVKDPRDPTRQVLAQPISPPCPMCFAFDRKNKVPEVVVPSVGRGELHGWRGRIAVLRLPFSLGRIGGPPYHNARILFEG